MMRKSNSSPARDMLIGIVVDIAEEYKHLVKDDDVFQRHDNGIM
jgi:hypothetical protein